MPYAAHQCVLQEIRESHAHGRALYGLVQLCEAAQETEGTFARDGGRFEQYALVHNALGRNDQCELAEAGAARTL